jgi:hypothetical protein
MRYLPNSGSPAIALEWLVGGFWMSRLKLCEPNRRSRRATRFNAPRGIARCERTRRSSDQRVHRNPVTLVTPIVRYPALNLSQIIYDHNNHTLLRRMPLRRDSLRIHCRTGYDASLSLSRLPAIQRRSVFVFRHRADKSFQALARLTTLPCLAQ